MAIFGYSLVPTSQDAGLPSPTPNSNDRLKSITAFGRARARWAAIALAALTFFILFGIWGNSTTEEETSSLRAAAQKVGKGFDKLIPAKWCATPAGTINPNYQPVSATTQWQKGSGRTDLSYNTPFNPDDLTMAEDECDAFFPGLYKDIDRSIEYFTKNQE
jgi:hypothetical protein